MGSGKSEDPQQRGAADDQAPSDPHGPEISRRLAEHAKQAASDRINDDLGDRPDLGISPVEPSEDRGEAKG